MAAYIRVLSIWEASPLAALYLHSELIFGVCQETLDCVRSKWGAPFPYPGGVFPSQTESGEAAACNQWTACEWEVAHSG